MHLSAGVQRYVKEEFQSFATNAKEIRSLLLQLLGCVHNKTLLEPCAGEGAFLRELLGTPACVDAIDIDTRHVASLNENFSPYVNAVHADFIDLMVSGPLFSASLLKECYDAIICNPPYGLKFSIEYRKKIKKLYPDFYVRESYGLFLLFGISLLRYEGRYVFIVPDTFLTCRNHKPLRHFLVREGRPTHLIRFQSRRFETVHFGYGSLCIIAGNHQPLETQHDVYWVDAVDNDEPLSYELLHQTKPTKGSYLLAHSDDGWVHSARKAAIQNPALTVRLGDIAECRTGIYTGNNTRFCGYDACLASIRGNGHPIDWKLQVQTTKLSDEEKQSGLAGNRHYVPLIKGGHREPFSHTAWAVDWSKEAITFYKSDKKARFQNARFYFRRGLAVPMVTSGRLSASLMDGAVFDQGVVGVFPHEEEMIEFLLLYLNSNFVADAVKRVINPGANNSANYIKKIPLPVPSKKHLQEAHAILEEAQMNGWKYTVDTRERFVKSLL